MITALLCLPDLSSSIDYRVYRESLGSIPLLRWWVSRVQATPGVKNVAILCHSDEESLQLADMLSGTNTDIYVASHNTLVRSLAQWATNTLEERVAIVQLSFPFGPPDLLPKVYAHHLEEANVVTEVTGLPMGATPTLFESTLLSELGCLDLPRLPGDPLAAFHMLIAAARSTNEKLPFSIKSTPFDVSSVYRLATTPLPMSVSISSREDVETARRVWLRLEPNLQFSGLDALQIWRQEQYRTSAERCNAVVSWAMNGQAIDRLRSSAETRPSVLYVSNQSAFSGSEQSLCQMVQHIDSNKFGKVALVAQEGLLTKRLQCAGATILCPNSDFGRGTVDNYLFVLSILQHIRPSIIHLNSLSGIQILCAAEQIGIPIVQHVRNRPREAYAEYLQAASAIIAISQFVKEDILGFGVPEEKVHVLYNEADCEYFRRDSYDRTKIRKELDVSLSSKLILMIARFTPYKRHDLLLEALALVRPVIPTVHVLLVGEVFEAPDHFDSIQHQIDDMGLRDIISLLPFQRDVRSLYVAADVLVLCSDGEPLGRCVVEAMAMETPVVVTDSGGTHEVVRHGQSGFVAQAGNAKELANCLIAALSNDEACLTMTSAARAFVESNLSARHSADRAMQIYRNLITPSPI